MVVVVIVLIVVVESRRGVLGEYRSVVNGELLEKNSLPSNRLS